MTGDRSGRQPSLATRRELIQATAEWYHAAARPAKKEILNEFIKVTGYHRKHAIRALGRTSGARAETAPRSRLCNEAARSALTILLGNGGSDLWKAVEGSDSDSAGRNGAARALAVRC
jgi:hypothetical protein